MKQGGKANWAFDTTEVVLNSVSMVIWIITFYEKCQKKKEKKPLQFSDWNGKKYMF